MNLRNATALLSDGAELAQIIARLVSRAAIKSRVRPSVIRQLLSQLTRGVRGPLGILKLHAAAEPERPAVISERVRLNYGQFDGRVERLAQALHHLGVRSGDRVGLLLDNGHEFLESSCALSRLGAFAVHIGYRLKAGEIAYIVSHSGMRAAICHGVYQETLRAALAEARRTSLPLLVADGEPAAGAHGYEELLAQRLPELPRISAGTYGGQLLYTSGTTGPNKGALRDLSTASLLPMLALAATLPLYPDDRHLVACPLYHAAAPAFVSLAMGLGGAVVIPRHFEAERVPALIAAERVTSSAMVPTMLRRLVELPELRQHDLSSLRFIVSVAAPLSTELAQKVEERLGPVLYNMYGATETGAVTVACPGEHTARPGTIGRRLLGNDIRLLDDDGREVEAGAVGELCVKSGLMISGYLHNPDATSKAQRAGYFTVGDLGRRDADGYYYITDRKNDMVISAGVNIYPWEIEQRLLTHPAVADCAVIGVPDAEWGESLCAFVAARPEHPAGEALAEALRAYVGEALAGYKRPRRVEFIEQIPRNPTGKVLKRALRERAAS